MNNNLDESVQGRRTWLAIVAALTFCAAGVLVLNLNKYNVPPFSSGASEGDSVSEPPSTTDAGVREFPDTNDLNALVEGAGKSWVTGRQENFRFTVAGSVPDQETKDLIEQAVFETYGSYSRSNIAIEPSSGDAAWLASTPDVVKSFSSLITDGGFALESTALHLRGTTPNDADNAALQELANLPGMPGSVSSEIEVSNLRDPAVIATREAGKVNLAGRLPTQALRDEIVATTEKLYSAENVTTNIAIEEDTYAPFVLARWEESLSAFFPFVEYRVSIENGTFSGELRGGLAFAQGEVELSARGEEFLQIFPALANRTNGPVFVNGHTDDVGGGLANLELSQRRAEVVKAVLAGTGIDEARIVATGKGDLEPVAPNDSEEGRASNRRVEVKWSL